MLYTGEPITRRRGLPPGRARSGRAARRAARRRAGAGGQDRRQEPARRPPRQGVAERHRAPRRQEELSLRAGLHARALHLARLAGGPRRLRREARREVHRQAEENGPRLHARAGRVSRRGARMAGRARAEGAARLDGHRGRLRAAPRVGAHAARRRLRDGVVAGRVRRPRLQPDRVADLRGRVLGRRRARSRQPERHLPPRPDAHGVRHPGAEGALSAAHGAQRRGLGPGLVRAERRQRHGGDPHQRAPRRRRLRAERPEDLVLARRLRRLDLLPGAHRPEVGAPQAA